MARDKGGCVWTSASVFLSDLTWVLNRILEVEGLREEVNGVRFDTCLLPSHCFVCYF